MQVDKIKVKQQIIEALKKIHDPELPINIYDLGLIYDIVIDDDGVAVITMTLTSPNCPAAEILPDQVQVAAKYIAGVSEVELLLTFNPPWNQDMMSEEARLELGLI